eukprot:symbB.v1.2.005839.t1/scaffold343.1/size224757/16
MLIQRQCAAPKEGPDFCMRAAWKKRSVSFIVCATGCQGVPLHAPTWAVLTSSVAMKMQLYIGFGKLIVWMDAAVVFYVVWLCWSNGTATFRRPCFCLETICKKWMSSTCRFSINLPCYTEIVSNGHKLALAFGGS